MKDLNFAEFRSKNYAELSLTPVRMSKSLVFLVISILIFSFSLNQAVSSGQSMKLNLSHIECAGEKAEVNFVVVHLPDIISNFGQVKYLLNGGAREAGFTKRSGDTAHYNDLLPTGSGIFEATNAYVIIDGTTVWQHNEESIRLDCETPSPTPSPIPSETPSPTPSPSATPSPSPTLTPTPTPSPTPEPSESPSPEPTPKLGVCPLGNSEGRTVIDFDGIRLRSDKTITYAESDLIPVSIDVGLYDIILVSFDNHSDKPSQSQPQESWHLKLWNDQEFLIGQTNSISDLPESQDWFTETVDYGFEINQSASFIQAVHSAHPTSSPNSVEPVCAVFDKVGETPSPTPSPIPSETPSPTPSPSATPSPSPTLTPTPTPSPTPSETPTATPTPPPDEVTPTPEPGGGGGGNDPGSGFFPQTPTPSPSPTLTPTPTPSPTPEPSESPSPEPTPVVAGAESDSAGTTTSNLKKVSGISTGRVGLGTGFDTAALSLILTSMFLGLYASYKKTARAKLAEIKILMKKQAKDKNRFNFASE